ncbi:uncharacterized protein [Ptychodera flava]|uniref:uncharacterized protein n=1 Tax=Ptychodera flava TaxID=63121 RepID=UPI00396A0638
MSSQMVVAILESKLVPMVPAMEIIGKIPRCNVQTLADMVPEGTTTLPTISRAEWKDLQLADPTIGAIYNYVQRGEPPDRQQRASETRQVSAALREWKKYRLRNGVLYRQRTEKSGRTVYQLYLPPSHRETAMDALHDEMGRLGQERSIELMRSRFYWPGMTDDIINRIRRCERCTRRKIAAGGRVVAPLVPILTTCP